MKISEHLRQAASDEDRAYAKDYITKRLKAEGFEYNPRFSPPFSRDDKDEKGEFNTSVSYWYPEQSMTANLKDFGVSVVQTEGKGRGGIVIGKQKFKAKDLNGFKSAVEKAIKWIG